MKVLIINTNQTDKNGVTNVIFNYLQSIKTSSIQMDVLAINKPSQSYKEIVNKFGGRLYIIERSAKSIIFYWFKLASLILNNRYDIVHIHGNSHTLVLELSAAWIAGCKHRIVHSHNTQCEHNLIHKIMTPLFNMLTTNRLACGEDAGKWMFGSKAFLVLKNGIKTNKFAFNPTMRLKIRNLFGWTEDDIVLGHVGYFYPVKNHKHILQVFKRLHSKNQNYKLLLIGDGPLKNDFEKELKDEGFGNDVVFTGNINNVADYLNAMDIILMPSIFEGLPLTLVEQQANGLPCVVSNNISTEVNITGNVKFLDLNSSINIWIDEINTDINKPNRAKMSEEAIKHIKLNGYDVDIEALSLVKYYSNLLS